MILLTKLGSLHFLGPVLLITIIAIIVVDLILYNNNTENDTISYIIKIWINGRSFFLIFLWGALAGRFFLSKAEPQRSQDISGAIIVLAIAALLFLAGVFLKWRLKMPYKVLLLVSGAAIGHFFWSISG